MNSGVLVYIAYVLFACLLQLCYMRECVPAASLSYVQPCSVGGNGLTCSGNGVYNNRAHLCQYSLQMVTVV